VLHGYAYAGTAQGVVNAYKQQATTGGATIASLGGIGDSALTIVQKNATSVIVLKGKVVFFTSGTTPHPLPLTVEQQLAQLVASRL
jgi:hypothetical protein